MGRVTNDWWWKNIRGKPSAYCRLVGWFVGRGCYSIYHSICRVTKVWNLLQSAKRFRRSINTRWKCTSTDDPQGNGIVERMVGNLRKTLQKDPGSWSKEGPASLSNLLYGCRHRPIPDVLAPFDTLLGVKSTFAMESSDAIRGEELLANAWLFENRAECLLPPTLQKGARRQIEPIVLLKRGKKPKGPKFQACMWLDLFKTAYMQRIWYGLENATVSIPRRLVDFRHLG